MKALLKLVLLGMGVVSFFIIMDNRESVLAGWKFYNGWTLAYITIFLLGLTRNRVLHTIALFLVILFSALNIIILADFTTFPVSREVAFVLCLWTGVLLFRTTCPNSH